MLMFWFFSYCQQIPQKEQTYQRVSLSLSPVEVSAIVPAVRVLRVECRHAAASGGLNTRRHANEDCDGYV